MSQDLPGWVNRSEPFDQTLVGYVGELFIQPEPAEVCLDSGIQHSGNC